MSDIARSFVTGFEWKKIPDNKKNVAFARLTMNDGRKPK